MEFATQTPSSVRRAVAVYVTRRRLVGVATWLLAGIAAAAAVSLAFMVVDRYAQWPQAFRNAGPWMAVAALLTGVVGAVAALLRQHESFRVAVRLDQAFPQHQDRWSSALDLAEQLEAGRDAGNLDSLSRLFADTESLPPRAAASIVLCGKLWGTVLGFGMVGMAILFVRFSPAFDLPLLWQRFIHPRADLPRDSATRIVITEVNGNRFTGAMPGPLDEGAPLSLRVELRRKPGLFAFGQSEQVIDNPDQLAPRLEATTAAGPRTTEFTRAGSTWVFTQPRLVESLEFRVRADDGLTQRVRAEVTPRIKLAGVETGIRFPRYTRMKDKPIAPMQGNRISELADSTVDFRAKFDRPFKSVKATYEAMTGEKDAAAPSEMERLGKEVPADGSAESSRRNLFIQKSGSDAARFSLRVDASGIVRLRAIGDNGLASEEWVCAVEAVPDAPPRIVVTGLEPNMTIVPGEISYQYRAEDDLAVTDIVMDWSSAGGIHQGTLGGDEYLRNSQLGQKVVAGEEFIQRMDYPFYATEPFQFFLRATDSKGQESRTETYRIHTVGDDYATRFDRGIELLKETGAYQQRFKGQLQQLANQLAILSTASGGAVKWDDKLNTPLDNFLRAAQNYDDPWFFVKRLTLHYGGVPYRLNRSLQVLMAVPDALASRADFLALGLSMKTTGDLPGAIRKLRALIEGQHPLLDAWGKALDAEKVRFLPEQLLNRARGPAARLAALWQVQSPEVALENLGFYVTQIDAWLAMATPLAKEDPQIQPLCDALKAACEYGKVILEHVKAQPLSYQVLFSFAASQSLIAALQPIIENLSLRDLPPADALTALGAAMSQIPAGIADAEHRFGTMVARMVMTAGQNELLRPAETIALARPWTDGAVAAAWYPPPASAADAIIMAHQVWETLRIYRADILAHRFELNPQAGIDHEIVLRERALSAREELLRVPAAGLDPAKRDKLAGVLNRLARPGAAADASLAANLSTAIRALGVKPVADLGPDARSTVAQVLAEIRKTADAYDRHADAVAKEAGRPVVEGAQYFPSRMLLLEEAARLQVRTEGLESLYRAVKLGIIESRLLQAGPAADWAYFEPLHGTQLGVSLAAALSADGVSRIHVEVSSKPATAAQQYPIAARNAKQLAERLRSTAQLLEDAMGGKPVAFDYAQLMKDARAQGLLEALQEEYELVRAHAAPAGAGANAEENAKLNKSALARIVRGEQALAPLAAAQKRLKQAEKGNPPELLAALQAVQRALPSGPDAPAIEALPLALKEAAAAPPDAPVASRPALVRQVGAVTEALASLDESFRDQARLPNISATAQQNRRFTTRDLPNVWVIGGVIDGFDRRWLYTMRDLELSLVRTMLEVAPKKEGQSSSAAAGADAIDLKLQYGRMVEWRARNFANDRRRNQGISLLAADSGPSLKLPEHIAEEFLRARNMAAPEEFKPRIEGYYEEIYRELAK